MPYKNEYSRHSSIVSITNSTKIIEFVSNMKIKVNGKDSFETIDDRIHECKNNFIAPKYVFSIDGSKSTIPLNIGLPGAEVSIIKCSVVLADLNKIKEYEHKINPHPREYSELSKAYTEELICPGYNVCNETLNEPIDFFRKSLFDFFKVGTLNISKGSNPITYLDTFSKLLFSGDTIFTENPCEVCSSNGHKLSSESFKTSNEILCGCSTKPKSLYLTDLLKFHESFNNNGTNEDVSTQLMNIVEKIVFINLIDNLELTTKNMFQEIINDSVFILDGPLAIFNTSSWLSERIENKFRNEKFLNLTLIGIEKTGNFIKHFDDLELVASSKGTKIKNSTIFYLNDRYIKKYIKYSNSMIPYGKEQYFGKKFFYKNKVGERFVVNTLYNMAENKDTECNIRNTDFYIKREVNNDKIIYLLDNFSSKRYENALSFVSMAHEQSSISSNQFSQRILDSFIKSNLSEDVYK